MISTPKNKPKRVQKIESLESKMEEPVASVEDIIITPEASPALEEKPQRQISKSLVKVKVLVGTLQYEGGCYQKGAIFETTKKRAAQFEPNDVRILKA